MTDRERSESIYPDGQLLRHTHAHSHRRLCLPFNAHRYIKQGQPGQFSKEMQGIGSLGMKTNTLAGPRGPSSLPRHSTDTESPPCLLLSLSYSLFYSLWLAVNSRPSLVTQQQTIDHDHGYKNSYPHTLN